MAGMWLDSKTGKVVTSQPEEGVQLVSPDVEPSDQDKAYVEAVKASLKGDVEVQTVTTKTARK